MGTLSMLNLLIFSFWERPASSQLTMPFSSSPFSLISEMVEAKVSS